MSLITKTAKTAVVSDPFPYIIQEGLLCDSLARQLIAEYPTAEIISKGRPLSSNQRFSYPAKDALANPDITPAWKQLVQEHVSPDFWRDLVRVFHDQVLHLYPFFEQRLGKLEQLKPGVRNIDTFDKVD